MIDLLVVCKKERLRRLVIQYKGISAKWNLELKRHLRWVRYLRGKMIIVLVVFHVKYNLMKLKYHMDEKDYGFMAD